jgi:hypothetical protein
VGTTKIDWRNEGWKSNSFKGTSGSFWKRRLGILWWPVIGDETWAHHHDPENKRQSMEYHHKESPAPKKFKTKALAVGHANCILELWWYCAHLLTRKRCYSELKMLQWNPKKSQKTNHKKGGRNLLCLASTRQCQASNKCCHNWCHWKFGVYRLPHPTYSLDLTPSDFHFFPKLKENLWGQNFSSFEEVTAAVW